MNNHMNESDRQEFLTDLRESLKMEAEAQNLGEAIEDMLSQRDPYDPVNSPSHYRQGDMEVIDIIDNYVPDPYGYYMGNVLKYVLRHMAKGKPKQDLKKAEWYLNRMIEDWKE